MTMTTHPFTSRRKFGLLFWSEGLSDIHIQADDCFIVAEGKDPNFYLAGISSLPTKWNKCTELKGDYIEK